MPLPIRSFALFSLVLTGGATAVERHDVARGVPPTTHAVVGDASRATAPRDLTVDEQVQHVLSRLAFGARPGDVARVHAMGVDAWIGLQLTPERIDDRAMDQVLASFPTLTRTTGELLRDYPRPGALLVQQRLRGDTVMERADSVALRQAARKNRQFVAELMAARVARAVGSERQLQEVMTDFWLNHFSVFVGKGQERYYLPAYERETIRPHTLGKFRDLLGAVAHSPAMLYYLDNAQSVADSGRPTLASRRQAQRSRRLRGAVRRRQAQLSAEQQARLEALQARRPKGLNENYARELLELHTLGVDGGYTQQDIIEVARALTGWTIRPARLGNPEFLFNGAAHDAGEKVVLGKRLKGGRGIDDGEDVLDLVARHPSTARFIARKLVIRFVSDSPPPALVDRAAATFRTTDGNIREVVRTIVTSPEFFARDAYRAKVKSPFEVVVSAARAVGAAPDTTPVSSLMVARLGAPIYGHQAPNGWPETGESWMNTGAILQRINFGLAVAGNRVPGARARTWSAYDALRSAPRDVQVAGVIDAFLGGQASSETREILATGENPFLTRMRDSSAAPSDEMLLEAIARDSVREGAEERGEATRGGERRAAASARGVRDAGGPPRGNDGGNAPMVQDQNRAGRRAALRTTAFPQAPRLSGLDQIIGLALGSPEFQRR